MELVGVRVREAPGRVVGVPDGIYDGRRDGLLVGGSVSNLDG